MKLYLAALSLVGCTAARVAADSGSRMRQPFYIETLRGGADEADEADDTTATIDTTTAIPSGGSDAGRTYASRLESVKTSVLEAATEEVNPVFFLSTFFIYMDAFLQIPRFIIIIIIFKKICNSFILSLSASCLLPFSRRPPLSCLDSFHLVYFVLFEYLCGGYGGNVLGFSRLFLFSAVI